MTLTVQGLAALEEKLKRIPQAVLEKVDEANAKNAEEFKAQVSAIVPRGGDDPGKLASTLTSGPGTKPHSVQVSIGGPDAPYPAHLEYGHMGPGGVHVPAEPFWWTSWRVLKKRFKARTNRAGSDAIRKFKRGGGGA